MKLEHKIAERYVYLEKVDTYLVGELYKVTLLQKCICGERSVMVLVSYPEDVEDEVVK